MFKSHIVSALILSLSLSSLASCTLPNGQESQDKSMTVENADTLFNTLSDSSQTNFKKIYSGCLDTDNPFIMVLDSPKVVRCESVGQNTDQVPSEEPSLPYPEDALRHDRSFFTERAIVLSYQTDGETKEIKNMRELKTIYAPIESKEEALSFVLLKTSFGSILTQDTLNAALKGTQANMKILKNKTQGTQITKEADGSFLVKNVFINKGCVGSAQSFRVKENGDVEIIGNSDTLFESPCPEE